MPCIKEQKNWSHFVVTVIHPSPQLWQNYIQDFAVLHQLGLVRTRQEQRDLERKYEELIAARGQLKGLCNKAHYAGGAFSGECCVSSRFVKLSALRLRHMLRYLLRSVCSAISSVITRCSPWCSPDTSEVGRSLWTAIEFGQSKTLLPVTNCYNDYN